MTPIQNYQSTLLVNLYRAGGQADLNVICFLISTLVSLNL